MAIEKFKNFAGQMVEGGIIDNAASKKKVPAVKFEYGDGKKAYMTIAANTETASSLIPKITKIVVHEQKVYNSPLEVLFTKREQNRFGIATEDVIMSGLSEYDETNNPYPIENKKVEGCKGRGYPRYKSQVSLLNMAASFDWTVPDRYFDREVLSESDAAALLSELEKQRFMSFARFKHNAYLRVVSDIVPGKVDIEDTTTRSGGGGELVDYYGEVEGYCGAVVKKDYDVGEPTVEAGLTISIEDSLDFLKSLKATIRAMAVESTDYNRMGVVRYNTPDSLVLVMTSSVLDAMDEAFTVNDGNNEITYKGIPTKSIRELIVELGVKLVEIPEFSDIPAYDEDIEGSEDWQDEYKIFAIIADKNDLFYETELFTDVESKRCMKPRETMFNMLYEGSLLTFKGSNAVAYVVPKPEPAPTVKVRFLTDCADDSVFIEVGVDADGHILDEDVPTITDLVSANIPGGWTPLDSTVRGAGHIQWTYADDPGDEIDFMSVGFAEDLFVMPMFSVKASFTEVGDLIKSDVVVSAKTWITDETLIVELPAECTMTALRGTYPAFNGWSYDGTNKIENFEDEGDSYAVGMDDDNKSVIFTGVNS